MGTFEELVETLEDETASSYSRRNALIALGRLRDERAVKPLASASKDEDRYIRSEATKALGELGSAAIEPLIEALVDSDYHVQRAAIVALGIIGDERAMEPLKQALEDQSYFTRSEAEKSIRKIEERLKESEITEEEAEPGPELPPPPVETEMTKEIIPEPEDVVKKESETSPPDEVPEGTATKTMEISDADRAKLRGKISQHQAQEAEKFAREIEQQQQEDGNQSSVFFDMLDVLTSGKKKPKHKLIIAVVVVVFSILMVSTKGLILPIVIMLAVAWLSIRRKRQARGGNTMDLLVSGLKNDDPKVRAVSARILGDFGDKRAVRPLWQAIEIEKDATVKKAIEEALAKLEQ